MFYLELLSAMPETFFSDVVSDGVGGQAGVVTLLIYLSLCLEIGGN